MSDWQTSRPKIGINWEYYSGLGLTLSPEQFKYESISLSRIDFLSLLFPNSPDRASLLERMRMTEKEELFARFFSQAYNKGKDISQMDFTELDSWIRELENTVFEAKATLQGASQAKREREANLKTSEREKIRTADGQYVTSDAINSVNKRKERMSKTDKVIESYRALGMSEEDINGILKNIKPDETSQAIVNQGLNLNKDASQDKKEDSSDKPKSLLDKIIESVVSAKPKEDSKPFSGFDDLFK